jgi:hypothetical protein
MLLRPILNQLIMYLGVVIIVLSFHNRSAACSVAGCLNDGEEMRPTFTIIVTHDERPLAGVNLHIVAKGTEQFSGITDDKGTIHVLNLPPGLYWLNADLLGTGVAYACFHVSAKPSRKAKVRLIYTWGDEVPAASKIAGRLVASQPDKGGTPIWNLTHRVDVPIAGANLTLRDPISHAVYMTTSDQDGHFFFEGLPNRTYVLHIEGGSAGEFTYDPANSVVELTNTAKRGELLFKGGPSGCGGNELALQLLD